MATRRSGHPNGVTPASRAHPGAPQVTIALLTRPGAMQRTLAAEVLAMIRQAHQRSPLTRESIRSELERLGRLDAEVRAQRAELARRLHELADEDATLQTAEAMIAHARRGFAEQLASLGATCGHPSRLQRGNPYPVDWTGGPERIWVRDCACGGVVVLGSTGGARALAMPRNVEA